MFRENRPWNEFVRAIILAGTGDGSERGASWFLYEQNNDHQKMAESIARWRSGWMCSARSATTTWRAGDQAGPHWGLVSAFNRSKTSIRITALP